MVTPGPFVFNRWTMEKIRVYPSPLFLSVRRVLLKSALRMRRAKLIG